jgi:hypothetical protein
MIFSHSSAVNTPSITRACASAPLPVRTAGVGRGDGSSSVASSSCRRPAIRFAGGSGKSVYWRALLMSISRS